MPSAPPTSWGADGRRLPLRGPQRGPPDQGRRGLPDRRARPPGPRLPRRRRDHPRRPAVRRRRDLPRLRLPEREPRAGPGLRRRRHHLHRPAGRRARAGRQQGAGAPGRRAAGIPTLRSTPPSADLDELVAGAEEIGFPVFVKAVAGGGGRGMRRVDDPASCASRSRRPCARPRARSATRPRSSSRRSAGRGTSRCRSWPTRTAHVMHLFERDCSIQRRHQKVVEIAPAPNISDELRAALCARCGGLRRVDQLLLRRHGGVPGGDRRRAGRPARLHRDEPADPGRAHGDRGDHRRRPGPGADADRVRRGAGRPGTQPRTRVRINGAALQCRITTEDPANGFRPDTGTITAYRTAGGAGVRLDGGTADTGVEISAALRLDAGQARPAAAGPSRPPWPAPGGRWPSSGSAGVSTNIPFLQAVLEDPDFLAGDVSTAFIEQRPELLTTHAPADRGTRLLRWLAEVTVNKPYGDRADPARPGRQAARPASI